MWSEQIPPVPLEIQEHRNAAVWLIARRRDKLHAGRHHPLVSGLEIVDAQEQADPSGELLAHDACLPVAVGTREQDAGLPSGGTNDHPPFRAAIVGP